MYSEPIYKVINKVDNTSLPTIYTKFIDAFNDACKWSDRAVIEYYQGEEVEEVWNPSYMEYCCEH